MAAVPAALGGEDKPTALQKAYDNCTAQDSGDTMDVTDGGHTLVFDTGSTGDVDGVGCAVVDLNTPDRIITNMDATSAMMGRQSEKANGLLYEWSYHPDTGMQLVISDNAED